RAATNRGVRSALRRPRGIDVQKTLYIAAPVDEVLAFWADYGNFPHFMSRVREVRPLDDSRSRWVVSGPGGVPVQWTAHVTRMVPGEAIEWESDPGSAVCHSGKVRFEPAGDGTRVDIRLRYTPP